MKAIYSLLILIIPFIGLGTSSNIQNNYRLGNYTKFKKNNIEFQVKFPMPSFVQTNQSFTTDGNNNLVVSYVKSEQTDPIVLQVFTTPIPERFNHLNFNEIFSNEESSKNFLNGFLGANTKLKISKHKFVNLNGKNFLVATSTLTEYGVTQKQINWITVHKYNFINIVGSTLFSNFSENQLFIENFGSSVLIN
jgi:hypothetical protein